MWIRPIAITLLLLSISGCKTFSAPAKHVSVMDDEVQWLHYVSDRRGALAIRDPSGQWKYCAEPFPDTATASNIAGSASKAETVTLKIDGKEDVVVLPGRSSNVLTIREALYRLCELSINRPSISDDRIMSAYSEALKSIQVVATQEAEAEAASANAAATVAQAAPTRTNLATAQSTAGYQKLLAGDYTASLSHFLEAERIFPSIHNNFEMTLELRRALADDVVSTEERLELLRKIQPGGTLNWRVPTQYAEAAEREVRRASAASP